MSRVFVFYSAFAAILCFFAVYVLYYTFLNNPDFKKSEQLSIADQFEARQLALKYCANCHLFPEPSLADRQTWSKYILPEKAKKLGLDGPFDLRLYRSQLLVQYPFQEEERITQEEFDLIKQYYQLQAPEKPVSAPKVEVSYGLELFEMMVLPDSLLWKGRPTAIRIDTTARQVLVGDDLLKELFVFDADLSSKSAVPFPLTVVDISMIGDEKILLSADGLEEDDRVSGRLISLGGQGESDTLLEHLPRPAAIHYSDLNADQRLDIVVCAYGHTEGYLAWYQALSNNRFIKHTLKNLPGSIAAKVADLDKDGLPDVVSLWAEGDEGFSVFYNKGKGIFKENRVKRFPPAWGSMHFDLADFNGDGQLDILYVNGFAGNYPAYPKYYQGIHILLNRGHNRFDEAYFLPFDGAYKAIANDFDLDGDLDIAAISYSPNGIPNFRSGFIYLQNQNNPEKPFDFRAFSLEIPTANRWKLMDIGDLDGDGDVDIALGTPTDSLSGSHQDAPSLLILKNTIRE